MDGAIDLDEGASSAPVFKSSRNRAYRRRERTEDSADEAGPAPKAAEPLPKPTAPANDESADGKTEDGFNEDDPAVVAQRLEEARALQKYRRRELGISSATLTRGEHTKRGRVVEEAPLSVTEEVESRLRSGGGLVRAEYVEKEMKKRKGIQDEDDLPEPKDILAELYTIPEHLKVDRPTGDDEKGAALPVSGGIIAMIPEVDLGTEECGDLSNDAYRSKLKNFEETERAKARLLEKRRVAALERKNFTAGNNFTGGEVSTCGEAILTVKMVMRGRKVSNTIVTLRMGNRYATFVARDITGGDFRHEARATDEIVLDKFKKREMHYWRGRGRGRR